MAGAALPPPTASAGRSHPITTMTYPNGLCKDKEEDVGPPVCFFLLSDQDLLRRECEALPLPRLSPQSGEYGQEPHWCPPTHGMATAPTQHRPAPTTGKGPARAHLQPLHGTTTQEGLSHICGSFTMKLAAVQQTSGTLHLGNRNLSHRDLQGVRPGLEENELASVKTQLKLKNSVLRTRPLLQTPQAHKCLQGCPTVCHEEPSTAFCSVK